MTDSESMLRGEPFCFQVEHAPSGRMWRIHAICYERSLQIWKITWSEPLVSPYRFTEEVFDGHHLHGGMTGALDTFVDRMTEPLPIPSPIAAAAPWSTERIVLVELLGESMKVIGGGFSSTETAAACAQAMVEHSLGTRDIRVATESVRYLLPGTPTGGQLAFVEAPERLREIKIDLLADHPDRCSLCDGTGHYPGIDEDGRASADNTVVCLRCDGTALSPPRCWGCGQLIPLRGPGVPGNGICACGTAYRLPQKNQP